jgi:hypothetical protein
LQDTSCEWALGPRQNSGFLTLPNMISGVLDMLPALHCLSHQSIIALTGLVINSCLLTTAGFAMRPCGIANGFITCIVLTAGSESADRNSWGLLTGAVPGVPGARAGGAAGADVAA